MKKATGPGKVETSPTPLGAVPGGVVALLFNFDFDDACVKSEHQSYLLEQLVPRLTAVADLRVFLRGMASQIGDAAYNLQLSRRRVEAVRTFLCANGVRLAQIVTSFTGEALSASKFADDERDRAVEAVFEASTGQARFDRATPTGANDGIDERADPQTVMVPFGVPRLVRLIGAKGAVVESLDPAVLRPVDPFRPAAEPVVATSDDFLLRLMPGLPGDTRLVAHVPQAATGPLATASLFEGPPAARPSARRGGAAALRAAAVAATMPQRVVDVAFHYVLTAPGGQPAPAGVRTQRAPNSTEEDKWLAQMNRIYEPQTNIRFVRAGPGRVVDSNGVQGPDVDVEAGPTDDRAKLFATPNAHKTARFRVFFVGRIGSFTMTTGGATNLGTPFSIIQDGLRGDTEVLTNDVLKVAQVLSHEAGHAFGVEEHGSEESLLMFRKAEGGEHIPLDVAGRMNAGARK